MKLSLLAATTLAYSFADAYAISGDGVNCRSGPGTSFAVKTTYAKGHDVTLSCQTSGTNVKGDSLWDKTSDDCYVSDYYVKTGTSGYVAAKCSGGTGGSPGGSSGSCNAPASNAATVNLIAEFEGWVDHVYTDATGHPTVGYGHLCSNSACSGIGYPIPMSQANGKKLLAKDMNVAEKCITAMTNDKVVLNLNQYGALVSWAFNMGCGAAKTSTLIERLNKGQSPQTVISSELPQWVHGGGKVLPGLVRRRKAEIALAGQATSDKALPVKC